MNIIIIALIFVVGFALSRNSDSVTCEIDDDVLLISGLGDRAYSIPFDEILSVSFGENLDYGTLVDGDETDSYLSGTFNNELFGNYSLYVCKDNSAYIELDTNIGICVFNIEDEADTEDYCNALIDLLIEGGYI